jgi:hypothetical protein
VAGPAIGGAMVLRRHGIGPRRAVFATLLANILGFGGVLVWTPLGMAELLRGGTGIQLPPSAGRWPIAVAGVVALTLIAGWVSLRWPGGRRRSVRRLLERHTALGLGGLRVRTLLALLPWAVVAWLVGALALYTLLAGESLHGPINPVEVIGAAALATTFGSLAFFVPAGIGIRDGAMITLLIHGAGLSLATCAGAVLAIRAIDLLTKAGVLLALRVTAWQERVPAASDSHQAADRPRQIQAA